MRVLLDTNVVIRSAEPSHPHHSIAAAALIRLRGGGQVLCVVPQIRYEVWVVATRPIAQNGLGMNASDADALVGNFAPLFFRLLRTNVPSTLNGEGSFCLRASSENRLMTQCL